MAYSNIEFKSNPGQFNIDEAQGIVECFVAGIGNKDSVGDVLVPGAFTESLKRRKPRVVWGHNWNDPIGKVLEIYEVGPGDPRLPQKMKTAGIGGLYARVQFNLNSEKGREAFANVAFFGHEQEWSIGYKTLDAIHDPAIQANVLKEVELYEVSPVLHGANQLTGTISVKSDDVALSDAEKGWGMMPGHHMQPKPMHQPNIIVIREDDDDDDKYESEKPIFAEGLAQPIGGEQRQRLEREIMERTGSQVRLLQATENTALFSRMMPNGASATFRIGYHTPDNYRTFMFGKPELANGEMRPSQIGKPSGSRVVVPSQMPSMPMQVKPNYEQNVPMDMFKSEDGEKSDLASQVQALEDLIMEEAEQKVGKTINKRNLSKLKSILEGLQEVIASAEKEEMATKGYVIPVELENAFHTKQLLDPIFDYHRVEAEVTEEGIVVTSGVTEEFIEAIGVAEKALGRAIGGGAGKVRRGARGLASRFDPNAWDGDGDGLVQEGTPFQRPAIPGVNDRSTRGRVDAAAATRAFQKQSGKKPKERGMASRGLQETLKDLRENPPSKPSKPVSEEFLEQLDEVTNILFELVGEASANSYRDGEYEIDEDTTLIDVLAKLYDETDWDSYSYQSRNKPKPTLEERKKELEEEYPELVGKKFSVHAYSKQEAWAYESDTNNYAKSRYATEIIVRSLDPEHNNSVFSVEYAEEGDPLGPEDGTFIDEYSLGALSSLKDRTREKFFSDETAERGMASRADADKSAKDAIAKEIEDNIRVEKLTEEQAELISKVVDEVNFEEFNDSPGKALSKIRRQIIDAVNDGDIEVDDEVDFTDSVADAIVAGLRAYQKAGVIKPREKDRDISARTGATRKSVNESIVEEWAINFRRQLENNPRPKSKKKIAEAKSRSERERERLLSDIKNGNVESQQELEEALAEIVTNDPTLNREKLVDEILESISSSLEDDPENEALQKLDSIYNTPNTREFLIDYADAYADDSEFNTSVIDEDVEVSRGMASRAGGGPGTPVTEVEKKKVLRDRAAVDLYKDTDSYRDSLSSWKAKNPGKSDKDFEKSNEFVDGLVAFDRDLYAQAEAATGIPQNRMMAYGGRPMSSEDATARSILRQRMTGASIREVAEKIGISPEKARSLEAKEVARLREEASEKEILAYRLGGLSLRDTANLFGMNPKDVRRVEAREMAKIRENMTDDDLLELRMMGFSLEDISEITGIPRTELRKREIKRINRGPEGKGPDSPEAPESRGMASQNIRPNSGVVKYSSELLDGKLDDLASDPQPGMAGATLDREWAEGVLAGLRDGRLSSDDAINIIGLAGQDVFNEGRRPEADRDQSLIDSRIKLSKRLRRAVVDDMSPEDMENYQADRRRRMGADRGMRSTLAEANRRRDEGLTPGTGDERPTAGAPRGESPAGYTPDTSERDEKIIQKLRDIGLSDDEITQLTGIQNLPTPERGMSSSSPASISKKKMKIEGGNSEIDEMIKDLQAIRQLSNTEMTEIPKLIDALRKAKENDGNLEASNQELAGYIRELNRIEDDGFEDFDNANKLRSIVSEMFSSRDESSLTEEERERLSSMRDNDFEAYMEDSRGMGSRNTERSRNAERDESSLTEEERERLASIQDNDFEAYMEDSRGMASRGNRGLAELGSEIYERDGDGALADFLINENILEAEDPLIRNLRREGSRLSGSPSYDERYAEQALSLLEENSQKERGMSSRTRKKFRSESGVINPHPKIEMTLDGDSLGLIVEDLDTLIRNNPRSSALKAARDKFANAKSGDKISMTNAEYEGIYRDAERAKRSGRIPSSELVSLLDQTVESKDGKYVHPDLGSGRGMASKTPKGRRPNNGAPTDMTEAMQKEYVFWARNNRNLYVAQRILAKYDENDGQLSPSDWRALETLYTNLSPRGGGRRSGMRSSGTPSWDAVSNEQVGRDRAADRPGMTAAGLGDIGVREEGVGRQEQPGPTDAKFTGSSFNDVKPDNWDELDLEEKFEWMFTDGRTENSGMSQAAYQGALKKLIEEEDKIERAAKRKTRGQDLEDEEEERGMSSSSLSKRAKDSGLKPASVRNISKAEKAYSAYSQAKSSDRGMRSGSGPKKQGRTMITDEATYFGQIDRSLPTEIRKATEARDSKVAEGLRLLQSLISRQEAAKTGDRRTNVGSLFMTADEADQILDAVMWVLDRQIQRSGNPERIAAFAKLVDKIAEAAMSTFIDKDTAEIGSRTQKRTSRTGRTVEIPKTNL